MPLRRIGLRIVGGSVHVVPCGVHVVQNGTSVACGVWSYSVARVLLASREYGLYVVQVVLVCSRTDAAADEPAVLCGRLFVLSSRVGVAGSVYKAVCTCKTVL